MAMYFRNFILRLARPGFLWEGPPGAQLPTGQGGRYLYGIGLILDAMAERLRQGTLARMPGYGTPTAYPYIGRDRGIERGFAASDEVYAAQLQKWLAAWKGAGGPWTLLEQLAGYLSPYPTKIRTVDNSGNWYTRNADGTREVYQMYPDRFDWDSHTNASSEDEWARMWVIIYANSFLELQPGWGNPAQWGGEWGKDGQTWGTSATPDQIADIKNICKKWSAAHTKLMTIILAFDDASFEPGGSDLPDGWWGNWHKVVGGVAVKSRLSTARYITVEQ